MASPAKSGASTHEIVARHDQTCWRCRGKCFEGSRVRWDKQTSLVEHVICPPVVTAAADAYKAPPVSPDLWKKYCKAICEMVSGQNAERKVTEEDRKVYDKEGMLGLIHSIINRTRCTGGEAVEIVRAWIDELKTPVDEAKFQAANEKCKAAV